jgi:hypothetical protein
MRLYELESDFDLTKKSKNKLFPSGPTFTWDPAKKQWLNPDGTQVARDIHFDLMKAVGLDPQGNKLKPGMIDKIKGAWAKSGAGIDPKASVLGKVMGRVGGAIGNAIGKAVAPKAAGADQSDTAPAKPGVGAAAAQAAPKPTQVNNPAVQNLNNYVKGVAAELNKPGANKIALTKELVNFMADRKGTPEWENASDSMKVILKRAGLDPKFANVALQRLQAGQTMESLQMLFINSLLEELNLTFDDLELSESVVEVEGIKHYIVEDNSISQLRKLAGI